MWIRAVVILLMVAGLIGYSYYGLLMTSQKLYERGILKSPPSAFPSIPIPFDFTVVLQTMITVGVLLTLSTILLRAYIERTRLLGIVKLSDLNRHVLIFGPIHPALTLVPVVCKPGGGNRKR